VRTWAWPRGEWGLEPLNAEAKAIAKYHAACAYEPWLPVSPRDQRGGIYLPGALTYVRGRNFPAAVEPEHLHPTMPQYRVGLRPGAQFGRRFIEHGETIGFLSWPEEPMQLSPANDAAREVLNYQRMHGCAFAKHGSPMSPWNCWPHPGALYLPKRSAVTKLVDRHEDFPDRAA
jgi:hypothetical protein